MQPANFIAKINKEGGLSRTNRYKVTIAAPLVSGVMNNFLSILSGVNLFDSAYAARYYAMFGVNPIGIVDNLEVFCDTCSLPGATFATTERKIYGPHSKHPYDQNFDEMSFTFLCGADMKERYFFDAWQYSVKDPITNNYNYPDEYTTEVIIRMYSVAGKFKYGVRLVDAWPQSVSSIELGYGDEGTARVNVNLAFKQWFNLKAYDTVGMAVGSLLKNNDLD